MMQKFVGYGISIVGIIAILLSSNSAVLTFMPAFVKQIYILIFGLLLVAVGVILVVGEGRGKVKHASEEVPIYQGTGKKRRIVGYRKSEK